MQTVYPLLGGLVVLNLMTTSFDKETASIDMMDIATTKLCRRHTFATSKPCSNLIKITPFTRPHYFICRGMGDLKKLHYTYMRVTLFL